RGKPYALRHGQAGDDQRARAQALQQGGKRRREEAGVLRFEDEVIPRLGRQLLDDVLAERVRTQAALDELRAVRAPAAAIVVDVDDRNARASRACGELRDRPGDPTRKARESRAVLEAKVRNQIDNE